jgi:hypothetical protein
VNRPTRESSAGRAYLDLQNLARRNHRPTDELLALYALEGFLDRLSRSADAARYVLKGGTLLAAYDVRRPTRDVDLHAIATASSPELVLPRICGIAGGTVDDGLAYDIDNAVAETIRDQDQYNGTRVSMTCQLAKARITFHVDVSVGDPINPAAAPLQLPRLLGGQIELLAYPLTMVFAEKIVTAIERRLTNTRWRDFADIYLLSRRQPIDGDELGQSLQVVADHRGAPLMPLSTALQGIAELSQVRWRAWVRKQKLDDRLPTDLGLVVAAVGAFADPAITGAAKSMIWSHLALEWQIEERSEEGRLLGQVSPG